MCSQELFTVAPIARRLPYAWIMNKFAVRYLLNLADPLRLERRPDWFKASCTTIMLGVNLDKVYTIMGDVSIGIPTLTLRMWRRGRESNPQPREG